MTTVPPFIDPQTEWVECAVCHAHLTVGEDPIDGMDISQADEYYPEMVPVCGTDEHLGDPAPDGGKNVYFEDLSRAQVAGFLAWVADKQADDGMVLDVDGEEYWVKVEQLDPGVGREDAEAGDREREEAGGGHDGR